MENFIHIVYFLCFCLCFYIFINFLYYLIHCCRHDRRYRSSGTRIISNKGIVIKELVKRYPDLYISECKKMDIRQLKEYLDGTDIPEFMNKKSIKKEHLIVAINSIKEFDSSSLRNLKYITKDKLRKIYRILRTPIDDINVPDKFLCEISLEIMNEPVTSDGIHFFEKIVIEKWLENNLTHPLTRLSLKNEDLWVDVKLKSDIIDYKKAYYLDKIL